MKKLENKVAVITGGTSGMALATAKLFVEQGAYVFITGRDKARLDKAVKEVGKNVTGCWAMPPILMILIAFTKQSGRRRARLISFSPVRVVASSPQSATEEHFDKIVGLNVRGTLFTVQKALPLFNDGGSIILNGSIASIKGFPAFGVYSASKAAVRSFARTWTMDLKAHNIRVNVLSPGTIDTPILEPLGKEAIDQFVSLIPRGTMGRPEEIATAALFLASSDSSFVTGVELFVDGGTAQI